MLRLIHRRAADLTQHVPRPNPAILHFRPIRRDPGYDEMPRMCSQRRHSGRDRGHKRLLFEDKVVGGEERHDGGGIPLHDMEQGQHDACPGVAVTRLDNDRLWGTIGSSSRA